MAKANGIPFPIESITYYTPVKIIGRKQSVILPIQFPIYIESQNNNTPLISS